VLVLPIPVSVPQPGSYSTQKGFRDSSCAEDRVGPGSGTLRSPSCLCSLTNRGFTMHPAIQSRPTVNPIVRRRSCPLTLIR
jgi:hypothetical protein